jgi:hypothetical protein
VCSSDLYDYGNVDPFFESTVPTDFYVVRPEFVASPVMGAVSRTSPTTFAANLYGVTTETDVSLQALDISGRILHTQDSPVTGSDPISLSMPVQIANQIAVIQLSNPQTAAQIRVIDQRDKRAVVGVIASESAQTVSPLLSENHYLENAVSVSQVLISSTLEDILQNSVDIIFVPGSVNLSETQQNLLQTWVQQQGGWLVQFAGETTKNSELLPVDIRESTRSLGGTLSWETPKRLSPFPDGSPFSRLALDQDDILIKQQVIADPSSLSNAEVWASLEDNTPLITARSLGNGKLVLFHVSANAEWSSLPLSAHFPEIVKILSQQSVLGESDLREAEATPEAENKEWKLSRSLQSNGRLVLGGQEDIIISEDMFADPASAKAPPGLYRPLQASESTTQYRPHNLFPTEALPLQTLNIPSNVQQISLQASGSTAYKKWFFLAALILLLIDFVISAFSGRGSKLFAAKGLLIFALLVPADRPMAQEAIETDTAFAYVQTGDSSVDRLSQAGLSSLSRVLFQRTSIEPIEPKGITFEQDIRMYPVVYWPILNATPQLSQRQAEVLSDYITAGGLLLIDTQGNGFEAERLGTLLSNVNIPALIPLKKTHVLHKTYYLLDALKGRLNNADIWISKPGLDETSAVIIADTDWAGGWAQDEYGYPLIPIDAGQQEYALRAGINLVMYAFTGTYKQDQIHVRALLDRMKDE